MFGEFREKKNESSMFIQHVVRSLASEQYIRTLVPRDSETMGRSWNLSGFVG